MSLTLVRGGVKIQIFRASFMAGHYGMEGRRQALFPTTANANLLLFVRLGTRGDVGQGEGGWRRVCEYRIQTGERELACGLELPLAY